MPDLTFGCDVYWEDDIQTPHPHINYPAMAEACGFTGIKASQGTSADPDYLINMGEAKDAGLLRFPYHFADYRYSWEPQYEVFKKQIDQTPDWEIVPCLDYEERLVWGTVKRDGSLVWIKAFLEQLAKDISYKPLIYINTSMLRTLSPIPDWLLTYPLWIAAYPYITGTLNCVRDWSQVPPAFVPFTKPWPSYLMWQFTPSGDGTKLGIASKGADLNVYQGTKEELRAEKAKYQIVASLATSGSPQPEQPAKDFTELTKPITTTSELSSNPLQLPVAPQPVQNSTGYTHQTAAKPNWSLSGRDPQKLPR